MHEFCHDGCTASSFDAGHAGDFDIKHWPVSVTDWTVFYEFDMVTCYDESRVTRRERVNEGKATRFVIVKWLKVIVEDERVDDRWYVFVVPFAAEED